MMVVLKDVTDGVFSPEPRRKGPAFQSKECSTGLALAHRVITEHGGTLAVANAPDDGAIFTVKVTV